MPLVVDFSAGLNLVEDQGHVALMAVRVVHVCEDC